MTQFETLVEGAIMLECPRWHDGRWYVSDMFRPAILTVLDDGTDLRTHASFDQLIAGSGWLPDGSMLLVASEGRRVVRIAETGTVSEYATVSELGQGSANEMVVDSKGNVFVGFMGFDISQPMAAAPPTGALARLNSGGEVTVVAEDLLTPNGMVITEDGGTLIVGETLRSRYTAFKINADGSLSDRRVWADLGGPRNGRSSPDGCTLDADGRIWFADRHGHRFVLVEEGGREVEELSAPGDMHAHACMLGGPDGRSLVMCCGPVVHSRDATHGQHVLLKTQVEVAGAGFP
jgi:sugar lactone lactonase YvrE